MFYLIHYHLYGWSKDGKWLVTLKRLQSTWALSISDRSICWCMKGFILTARTSFALRSATNSPPTLRRLNKRKTLVFGLHHYTRSDLEAVRAAGQKLQIQVLGLASIADDVSPELAQATIDSLVVLGALRASTEVRAALADRIH